MALDRDQDVVIDSDVDEDDMPPLVEDPNPTYTFFSGTTPLSFTSTSAPTATQDTSPQPSSSLFSSLPASPINPDESISSSTTPMSRPRPHGKRRDPSYIPRPPNAFILFRCAFIRDQNVTGKVEGNHSRLSKIIGLCWKQLTPEQREEWEVKAVEAQAEHRANYPDWRFRPGANALAKLKSKEGSSTGTSRRRSVRRTIKEQPTPDEAEEGDSVGGGDTKGKGKAKAKSSRIPSIEEIRCAKIAGFVAEGIRGEELEVAVKEWEGDRKIGKTNTRPVKSKGRPSQASSSSSHLKSHSITISHSHSFAKQSPGNSPQNSPVSPKNSRTPSIDLKPPISESSSSTKISSAEQATNIVLPDLPLTHMFKRSLSAPVSNARLPSAPSLEKSESLAEEEESPPSSAEPSPGEWGTFKPLTVQQEPPTRSHNRRDTISLPMPSGSSTVPFDPPHLTWQEAENQRRIEDLQGPDSWWSSRTTSSNSHFAYTEHKNNPHSEQNSPVRLSTDDMGYESSQQGNHFDRAYIEQYGAYEHVRDGSQHAEWTNLSSMNNRSGMVTVIDDPYKDDCNNNNSPSTDSPPTLSLPPPSSGNYYRSPVSPVTSPTFPSSSFSTLTGWAGEYDYKDNTSDVRTWPSENNNASSSAWYNNEGAHWNIRDELRQLHHQHMDAEDWDRREYRAASELRYPVQPPRELDFLGELRRMHGGAA